MSGAVLSDKALMGLVTVWEDRQVRKWFHCQGENGYQGGVGVSGRTLTWLGCWGLVLAKVSSHMLRSVTHPSHSCSDPRLLLVRLQLHDGVVRRVRALRQTPRLVQILSSSRYNGQSVTSLINILLVVHDDHASYLMFAR